MNDNLKFTTSLAIRLRTEIDIKGCCVKACDTEATHCHYLNLKYDLGHVDLYTCDDPGHIEMAMGALQELKETCDAVSTKIAEIVTEH